MEERRIKEIQTYFDAVSDGDPVLGDLAMIINDPHATHTLLHNIFHLLTEIVDQGLNQQEYTTICIGLIFFFPLHREITVREFTSRTYHSIAAVGLKRTQHGRAPIF